MDDLLVGSNRALVGHMISKNTLQQLIEEVAQVIVTRRVLKVKLRLQSRLLTRLIHWP